jgi:hypothetical protein
MTEQQTRLIADIRQRLEWLKRESTGSGYGRDQEAKMRAELEALVEQLEATL